MRDEHKKAFEKAWTDPDNADRILKMARGFAGVFECDPLDLVQAAFLRIWNDDDLWKPGDNVVYVAGRVMRDMKSNEKRLQKHKREVPQQTVTNEQGEEERVEGTSSRDTAEDVERKRRWELRESVLDEAGDDLPQGTVGDRARVVLREAREGNGDADALVDLLGCTVDQFYKARVLLAETIQRVLKRRGLPPETMNLDE